MQNTQITTNSFPKDIIVSYLYDEFSLSTKVNHTNCLVNLQKKFYILIYEVLTYNNPFSY